MEVNPEKLLLARRNQPRVSYEEALKQTSESLRRSVSQGFEVGFDCAKIGRKSGHPEDVIAAPGR